MKKAKFITMLGLGILTLGGIGLGIAHTTNNYAIARAADSETSETEVTSEEETTTYPCTVTISTVEHGEIAVDKTEGEIGEVVTITATHDLFYLIDYVAVNGTNLVESEDTSGLYTFALVEGENVISANFIIDEELLGEMSVIMDQALSKDWENLFSVENVVRIVSFLLNGGLLIAIVRYFVKDKRLEAKLESKVQEVVTKLVPNITEEAVKEAVQDIIVPLNAEYNIKAQDILNGLTVFSRCFALAQENTPEARIAITKELASLKFSDQEAISIVKAQLEQFILDQKKSNNEMIEKMNAMEAKNKEIAEIKEEVAAEEEVAEKIETVSDDGTQI